MEPVSYVEDGACTGVTLAITAKCSCNPALCAHVIEAWLKEHGVGSLGTHTPEKNPEKPAKVGDRLYSKH